MKKHIEKYLPMKKHIEKYLPIAIGSVVGACLVITIFVGVTGSKKGSDAGTVPFTSGTEDISVDVCINQECEYVADGQSDEREIKQAISAVLSAGGGTVNIRTGSYNISSAINFSLSGESLIIKGDGFNTQLTNSMTDSSADGTMFVVTGDGSSLDNLSIRDMYFIGSANCGAGVFLTDVYRAEVSGSKFYNFSASGSFGTAIKTSGMTKLVLSNNLFNSNTANTLLDGASTIVYKDRDSNDVLTIDMPVPSDGAAATSTGGSLTADTYYFKITTTDGVGQSLPSSEFSCAVGTELSGTSTQCIITWTDVTGDENTRIWMATTSDTYYGYYTATTSGTYYFATSTSLTSATMPTQNTAYVVKIASNSDSYILGGALGVGTTTIPTGSKVNIEGLLTQEGAYCEIYQHDATSSVSVAAGVGYTKVTGFDLDGSSKNCTNAVSSDKITITKKGVYKINGAFNFYTDTNNVVARGSAFLNGVEQNQIHWVRKIGTAGDIGSASFSGFIVATTTPVDLDFRVRHDEAGTVEMVFEYINFNINYIGE